MQKKKNIHSKENRDLTLLLPSVFPAYSRIKRQRTGKRKNILGLWTGRLPVFSGFETTTPTPRQVHLGAEELLNKSCSRTKLRTIIFRLETGLATSTTPPRPVKYKWKHIHFGATSKPSKEEANNKQISPHPLPRPLNNNRSSVTVLEPQLSIITPHHRRHHVYCYDWRPPSTFSGARVRAY